MHIYCIPFLIFFTDFGFKPKINQLTSISYHYLSNITSSLSFTAVAAFILNVFVIIVCVKKRNSLVPADYFIVNLAACDLILSFVGLPFGITSSFFHQWKFGSGGEYMINHRGIRRWERNEALSTLGFDDDDEHSDFSYGRKLSVPFFLLLFY